MIRWYTTESRIQDFLFALIQYITVIELIQSTKQIIQLVSVMRCYRTVSRIPVFKKNSIQ